MTQGDSLNEKKRRRRSSEAVLEAVGGQSFVVLEGSGSNMYHDLTGVTPAAEPAELPPPATTTAPSEFLRSQLLFDSTPLPNPGPREDQEAGGLGGYWEARNAASIASPQTVRSTSPQQDIKGYSFTSSLMTEPVPLRPLRRGDFYYRPDLDSVSQGVVLASLHKQRLEEAEAKDAVKARREVILAKFNAQRRDRVDIAMRTGLKVPAHVAESFGMKDNHERRLKKEVLSAKARKDAQRNVILEHRQVPDAFLADHRQTMLRTMDKRRSQRSALEESLGTSLKRQAEGGATTIGGYIRQHAEDVHAAEEVVELAAAQSFLDTFDAADRSRQRGYKKKKGGEGEEGQAIPRPPRQRELPYTIDAPYRHISQHRARIVMTEAEKKAVSV